MKTFNNKRILFIDDEVHIREVVQICLETLGGWDVILAASGREGLVKAQIEKPDAILLDMMMPGLDGIAVLQHLQSHSITLSIPVIFLTAKANLIEPERFFEWGAKGAIAKPFNPLTLVSQIAEILGWSINLALE
ncbi:MAG TPA: response regulator [Cyanobacteria bacterium UBA11370]|nr:response regulator [Cyanobacteria bacterium UBA11370]HBY77990.1 response regulator [Cyanobacteria bacterium UBA11148]